MANDLSFKITAVDNFSKAINTMKSVGSSFSKDMDGLQSKLKELNKTKAVLKVDTDKAMSDLKKAETQFAKTGKAADKMKYLLANEKYENANRNLSLVSDNAKQAEKDIQSLAESGGKSQILGKIKEQAGGKLLDVGKDMAVTYAGSAYGQEAGIMVDNMSNMAIMGATIGSTIAPGIGTAIGALGGAVVGIAQGLNEIFKNKDEAFKNYYKDLYDQTQESQIQALNNGSGIAASREADKIPFNTLLGNSQSTDTFLSSITEFAERTSFNYDDLSGISKTLLSNGMKQEEIIPLLQNVGDAGAALGMGNEDMKVIAASIGKIQSSEKVTMADLSPLLEKGIDVWKYLKSSSEETKEATMDMVRNGLLPGAEAAKKIADSLGADYAGNMDKQSKTFTGLKSNLDEKQNTLDSAMGEGYNSTREVGMQEELDWMSGSSGKNMQDAYNKIGQYKAELENMHEQYQRDAINSVMSGNMAQTFDNSPQKTRLEKLSQEYSEAQGKFNKSSDLGDQQGKLKAGADMGRIISETQAIGENEYNASYGGQTALESSKQLAENIKNDSASQTEYWNAGYSMGQEFTEGLKSAIKLTTLENGALQTNGSGGSYTPPNLYKPSYKPYAYGLNSVPYNNYPALLHEGERVLTAGESRRLDKRKAASVSVTGNTFVVREEGDIERIANEIARLFNSAYQLAEG